MPEAEPLQFDVFEDGGFSIMARVVGQDAARITQASLTSISYSTFDRDSDTPDTAIIDATALTVANVVFDTLLTDDRWTVDGTGYNFRHDVAATAVPTGGHCYRFEYLFTPSSGEAFWLVAEINARAVSTS